VLEIMNNLLSRVEFLMITAVVVMAIWFVVWTWVRTRSLVPVISALLLGAVIIWGVTNYTKLETYIGEDVNDLDG
jgi:hypothetical protein